MTPNEYVKLALITESDNFSNPSLIGRLSMKAFQYIHKGTLAERFSSKRVIRLNHATIGIATEMEELLTMLDKPGDVDKVNLIEEIADALWYCALAVDELGLDFEKLLGDTTLLNHRLSEEKLRQCVERETRESVKVSGRLLDLMKKGALYGKPLNVDGITENLKILLVHLSANCHLAGFPIEYAMERNIAKLSARYQGKFSSHAAFNRDLKTEREILEGKK